MAAPYGCLPLPNSVKESPQTIQVNDTGSDGRDSFRQQAPRQPAGTGVDSGSDRRAFPFRSITVGAGGGKSPGIWPNCVIARRDREDLILVRRGRWDDGRSRDLTPYRGISQNQLVSEVFLTPLPRKGGGSQDCRDRKLSWLIQRHWDSDGSPIGPSTMPEPILDVTPWINRTFNPRVDIDGLRSPDPRESRKQPQIHRTKNN